MIILHGSLVKLLLTCNFALQSFGKTWHISKLFLRLEFSHFWLNNITNREILHLILLLSNYFAVLHLCDKLKSDKLWKISSQKPNKLNLHSCGRRAVAHKFNKTASWIAWKTSVKAEKQGSISGISGNPFNYFTCSVALTQPEMSSSKNHLHSMQNQFQFVRHIHRIDSFEF